MLFFLSTPEFNNTQSNTQNVKVHLRNGIAQIFDQHQDLMGLVDNNIVEVETASEKTMFVVQDAVFVVSTKGLDQKAEVTGTSVYIYARRAKEIKSTVSLDELAKLTEQKNSEVDALTKVVNEETDPSGRTRLTSKLALIKDEVAFLKKVSTLVKEVKG